MTSFLELFLLHSLSSGVLYFHFYLSQDIFDFAFDFFVPIGYSVACCLVSTYF